MPTDDERREVARRLRGDPCDTLIPYKTGIHFGMGCHEAANRFWDMCERIKSAGDYDIAYSTRSVLADLIDPDTTKCDRDALLALAEELDGLGLSGFSSGWSSGAVNVGSFARRIRKALGVEP